MQVRYKMLSVALVVIVITLYFVISSPSGEAQDVGYVRVDRYDQFLQAHKTVVLTAAVSGIYYGHPEASYFAVGKINREQVEEYAQRKGMSIAEVEYWLAPNLGYDPE